MILAEYTRWLRYFKGRVLLTALVLGVGGCHALWYALPRGSSRGVSDVETPYSSLSTRAVVRGGR